MVKVMVLLLVLVPVPATVTTPVTATITFTIIVVLSATVNWTVTVLSGHRSHDSECGVTMTTATTIGTERLLLPVLLPQP